MYLLLAIAEKNSRQKTGLGKHLYFPMILGNRRIGVRKPAKINVPTCLKTAEKSR
jgi:hypothetical protein